MEEAGAEKQRAAEEQRALLAAAALRERKLQTKLEELSAQRTQLERRCSARTPRSAVAAATRRTLESGGWPAPRKFDGEEASSGGSLASSRPEAAPAARRAPDPFIGRPRPLRAALRNGHS